MKNGLLFMLSALILGAIFVLDANSAPVYNTIEKSHPKKERKIKTRLFTTTRALALND